MKYFLLFGLVFLVSCGKNGGTGGNQEVTRNPACGDAETLCLKRVDWTIDSSSVSFPQNFRLLLEGLPVLDTCKTRKGLELKEREGRTLIKFNHQWIPNKPFKVELLDLGGDCTNDAVFHLEEELRFGTGEIVINGVKESSSVWATLNN